MSISTNIENLSFETRQKLAKDLEIKIEPKTSFGQPRFIYPFEIEGDNIQIPFGYAARNLKLERPKRKNFPIINVKFQGVPRAEQVEILKESLSILSSKGSLIISCYTGFGKCLKINTPIIMYDGTIKVVQDIKVGDLLMGDDSTSRKVISTCTGQEQMYNIIPTKGDTFGCNESHILSLKISSHKKLSYNIKRNSYYVRWIDKSTVTLKTKYFKIEEQAKLFRDSIIDDDIIDIEVKDFLKLPIHIKHILKLYRVPVDFTESELPLDPYMIGYWLGDGASLNSTICCQDSTVLHYFAHNLRKYKLNLMYVSQYDYGISGNGRVGNNQFLNTLKNLNLIGNKHIPLIYKCNSRENRLKLLAGLLDSDGHFISGGGFEFTQKNELLMDDVIYLARSLGFSCYKKEKKTSWIYKEIKKYGTTFIISINGKSIEDIPTLIPRKRASPRRQIKDALVTGFKIVPTNDKDYYGFVIDGNHRFLLGDFTVTHNTISSINLACSIGFKTLILVNKLILIKQWREAINNFCPSSSVQCLTVKSYKEDCDFYIINCQNVEKMGKHFFDDIGLVICDEVHLLMAETLSKSLQCVYPRYLLGLSATPYRVDGLDKLLDLYFGKNKIVRELFREHTAYKVSTGFKPTIEYTQTGAINWNTILESQADDITRNSLILKIISHFKDKTFLVLVKRISQGEYLESKLIEMGENVTSLLGKNQVFDVTSRILIGTTSKVGTGFDHPKLNTLMLACDVEEYFIQYLGRIFRTKEGLPIIFDLVDNNSILNKHWNTRRKIYQDHGGTVINFDLNLLK